MSDRQKISKEILEKVLYAKKESDKARGKYIHDSSKRLFVPVGDPYQYVALLLGLKRHDVKGAVYLQAYNRPTWTPRNQIEMMYWQIDACVADGLITKEEVDKILAERFRDGDRT